VSRHAPPETCPVCGEEVPRNARACPECDADHRTGWNDDATGADGLDLPDHDGADFDYQAFVEEEFGTGRKPRGIGWGWWLAAVIALAAFLALALGRG